MFNKFDELNNLASLSHINIIGVTETWLHMTNTKTMNLVSQVTFFSTKTVLPAKEKDELPST